jgi:tRNA(Arg) A34 adenosine deaminase TadA
VSETPRYTQPVVSFELPDWVARCVGERGPCASDEDRMRLAIALADANARDAGGGPFGAAVFERGAAWPLAVGVNRVVPLANACAHAELIALTAAQARLGSHTLRVPGAPARELFTSCAPCAMCLGAALWSGVSRIVCAASRDQAETIGFDEGPVFDASWAYLADRGVEAVHGLLAAEAGAVLEAYAARGGLVYNG